MTGILSGSTTDTPKKDINPGERPVLLELNILDFRHWFLGGSLLYKPILSFVLYPKWLEKYKP